MALPELTPEQRQEALRKAGAARTARAEFKARLASGRTSPVDGLEEALGDETLGRIRVTTFLGALPRWGEITVDRFVRTNGLTANRSLRGLGKVQLQTVKDAVSR